MTSLSSVDRIPHHVRPLVLVALFGTGLILMWYFAESVAPAEGFLSGSTRKADQAPAPVKTAGGNSSMKAEGGSSQERIGLAHSTAGGEPANASSHLNATAQPDSNRAQPAESDLPVHPSPVRTGSAKRVGRNTTGLPATAKSTHEEAKKLNFPAVVVGAGGLFVETEPILFNTGLSRLRDSSIPPLNKLADMLREHTEIQLSVIGHTDNLGPEPVNQSLSVERAAVVVDYLVARGVDRARLESKGSGSQDPIATNNTQIGRQANRRIAFLVTGPK